MKTLVSVFTVRKNENWMNFNNAVDVEHDLK